VSLLGVSMPIFWLGLIFILVFGVNLHWFPVSGRIQMGLEPDKITGLYLLDSLLKGNMESFKSAVMHLALPAVALASYSTAIIARMTRATMLEVVRQDYIRTARAKGILERPIITRHALKNALIPIVTVIGLQFGSLLGGAVLTETIFSWPGVGSYLINSLIVTDYPVVQASVLLLAVVFVMMNLIVDVVYAYIDPRIKYS
jgi:ABC-type dipeptide/oligopeptide/nickel transport system permease component